MLRQTIPVDSNGLPVHNPTAQYAISDQDVTGVINYYGYVGHNGQWYIMQETVATGAYRYCTSYTVPYTTISGAWDTRANLTYGYFYEVF